MRLQSLNCPRCGRLTVMAPISALPKIQRHRNEILVPEVSLSRDLNEHMGRRKTLIKPAEDE